MMQQCSVQHSQLVQELLPSKPDMKHGLQQTLLLWMLAVM